MLRISRLRFFLLDQRRMIGSAGTNFYRMTCVSSFAIDMTGTALSVDNDTELWILNAVGNLVFNNDGWTLSHVAPGDLAGNTPGIYLVAHNLFSSVPTYDEMHPLIGWDVRPFKTQTGTVQLNLTGAGVRATGRRRNGVGSRAEQFAAFGYGLRRLCRAQAGAKVFLAVS
jgi:hypothetical protein